MICEKLFYGFNKKKMLTRRDKANNHNDWVTNRKDSPKYCNCLWVSDVICCIKLRRVNILDHFVSHLWLSPKSLRAIPKEKKEEIKLWIESHPMVVETKVDSIRLINMKLIFRRELLFVLILFHVLFTNIFSLQIRFLWFRDFNEMCK